MKVKIQNQELEVAAPITVYDAAREAELISRAVIGAEISGKTVALTQPLSEGDDVKLLTFEDAASRICYPIYSKLTDEQIKDSGSLWKDYRIMEY